MPTIYVDRYDNVEPEQKRHAYKKNGDTMNRVCGCTRNRGNLLTPAQTLKTEPTDFAGKNDACRVCLEILDVESETNSVHDVDVDVQELFSDSSDSSGAGVEWRDMPKEDEDVPMAEFEPDTEEPAIGMEDEVPETISLEPDWDWLGVQLAKLGLTQMARRAFSKEMSPAEVYGGGLENMLIEKYHNGAEHLDMGYPDGRLSLTETPVKEAEVKMIKHKLGVIDEVPA